MKKFNSLKSMLRRHGLHHKTVKIKNYFCSTSP